jgi:hypothetical protein
MRRCFVLNKIPLEDDAYMTRYERMQEKRKQEMERRFRLSAHTARILTFLWTVGKELIKGHLGL